MNSNNEKMKTKICFLSGKGGAGKTSVSISLASLLSYMGYKILLVDWDLNTHGASYFFIEYAEKQKKIGILEFISKTKNKIKKFYKKLDERRPFGYIANNNIKNEINKIVQDTINSIIVEINKNFHFIPSKTKFKDKTWELLEDYSTHKDTFDSILNSFTSIDYDFIIYDTQAGPTAITRKISFDCEKAIIISEPDPISIAASKNIDYEMHDDLPVFTRFLINKLSTDEVINFRSIKQYLTIFEHLSPIPFDFSVRKAFSLRQIPINIEGPTPFLLGIVDMAKEILPLISERCDSLRQMLKKKLFGEIRNKKHRTAEEINHLIVDLKELEEKKFIFERNLRKRKASIISATFITFSFIAMFSLYTYSSFANTSYLFIFAIAFSFIAIIPIIYERIKSKMGIDLLRTRKQIESLSDEIRRLKDEHERYETMILEKADKYMIEPD